VWELHPCCDFHNLNVYSHCFNQFFFSEHINDDAVITLSDSEETPIMAIQTQRTTVKRELVFNDNDDTLLGM